MVDPKRVRQIGACMGASMREVRTTEWMEECRACGNRVRHDLVDHPFFGFKAGCDRWKQFAPKEKSC